FVQQVKLGTTTASSTTGTATTTTGTYQNNLNLGTATVAQQKTQATSLANNPTTIVNPTWTGMTNTGSAYGVFNGQMYAQNAGLATGASSQQDLINAGANPQNLVASVVGRTDDGTYTVAYGDKPTGYTINLNDLIQNGWDGQNWDIVTNALKAQGWDPRYPYNFILPDGSYQTGDPIQSDGSNADWMTEDFMFANSSMMAGGWQSVGRPPFSLGNTTVSRVVNVGGDGGGDDGVDEGGGPGPGTGTATGSGGGSGGGSSGINTETTTITEVASRDGYITWEHTTTRSDSTTTSVVGAMTSGVEDFVDGLIHTDSSLGVMSRVGQTYSTQAGMDARQVINNAGASIADFFNGAIGRTDYNNAVASYNNNEYFYAALYGMRALGNAGLTLLSSGLYGVGRAGFVQTTEQFAASRITYVESTAENTYAVRNTGGSYVNSYTSGSYVNANGQNIATGLPNATGRTAAVEVEGANTGAQVNLNTIATNSAGAGTLANNRLVGAQAESDATRNFTNQGLEVNQRVSLTDGTVRAVGDVSLNGTPGAMVQIPAGFVAEDLAGNLLLDASGNPITSFQLNSQGQAIIEVKTGGATLSTNQATVYPLVQSGGAAGVGGNAVDAGMAGALPATPVIIIRR
ncbi:hypothetical protein, partial [Undibacterium sp. Ji49W]|uniref:hypothetical protein n=1 Tax=Undibacterium sp. Ji49W TaxID=3413040 RepID=UPI003BF0E0B0